MTDSLDWLSRLRSQLPKIPLAAVFGSSLTLHDDPCTAEWGNIGGLLATAGFGVFNGGCKGTMLQLALQMRNAGGHCIGVTCASMQDSEAAAAYSQILNVDTPFQRLEALLRLPDFYIILPGGIGTLLELSGALWLMDRGLIPSSPVLLLGDHWEPTVKEIQANPLMWSGRASAPLIQVENNEALAATLPLMLTELKRDLYEGRAN